MSFSGRLDDVPVVDLLQFIRIGQRTGTLTLTSELQHAEIGFHTGRIVNASGPGSLRLGELLLVAGLVNMETLDAALETQASERPRRTLGRILADGGLPVEEMHRVVRQQIQEVVRNVVTWRRGSFEFAPDELRNIAELELAPGEGANALQLDTQSVLLDALRLLDEHRRDSPPEKAMEVREVAQTPKPLEPAASALQTRLHVVTRDDKFVEALVQKLEGVPASLVRVGLHEAGTPLPGEPPPLVLLDLRTGGVNLEALSALRRTRPRAWIAAVVDQTVPAEKAVQAGALTAFTADVGLWAGWIKNLLLGREPEPVAPGARKADLSRLRRLYDDLRSGFVSTSISLSLMNVVSESVERCVLFLVRPDALVALGAFGAGPSGRSLAQAASGMKFDLQARNAFTACLESNAPLVGRVEEGTLPASYFHRMGRPRTGQFAVFPVMGGQRVIALVYVDNGVSDRAIGDLDVLELASAQAGLAFENELLRREVQRPH